METLIGIIVGFIIGSLFGWRVARQRAGAFTKFSTDPDSEAMVLAREAVSNRTDKRLARIMAAAEAAGKITNDGVEDLFCISDRTASTYLRQLTKAGKLSKQGGGRSTYYVPL